MEKYALMAAAFGALAITAASGLLIIPALRRLHFGQTIKEIGPTWHQGKNGTPTMGGLTFYLGVLVGVVLGYTVLALSVPSLLGGWLSGTSVSLFIGVLTAYAFGLVGFVDDYIKVVKKRNLGLMARYKIVAQVLITGAYLSSLYLNGTLSTIVTLPLLGAVDFGWFFYVLSFLLIIGMVNAVNLTDGIDGLASSVTFVVMMGFMFIASLWETLPWRCLPRPWRAAARASLRGTFTRPKRLWAIRAVCSWGARWWPWLTASAGRSCSFSWVLST